MSDGPRIPPPFKFARAFHSLDPLTQGVAGCSLSYQLQMLQPRLGRSPKWVSGETTPPHPCKFLQIWREPKEGFPKRGFL